ncbi:MAG: hypothetical protein CSA70_06495 [Rhodobacterales bacterium]|nr:MAG: hypothetical protein CSA70_06495 [Rhodobacterales bacterium]
MLGGALVAPALPLRRAALATGAASARVGGYNTLLYGLARFHAQTRSTLSANDLVPRLGVSSDKAKALMSELVSKGVVEPATGAA